MHLIIKLLKIQGRENINANAALYKQILMIMCEASMSKYGLAKNDIVDFVKFVPTSTIGGIKK